MTYELALKLKNTGFPQNPSFKGFDTITQLNNGEVWERSGEKVYLPSLLELVEACGDKFCLLQKHSDNHWHAISIDWNDEEDFEGYYESPEEAVANLWLALNDKSIVK